MSAPINTGGPAFPVMYCSEGMTLRDYFAGQALVGMLQNYTTQKFGVGEQTCARGAYEFADAMLAARERKEGDK